MGNPINCLIPIVLLLAACAAPQEPAGNRAVENAVQAGADWLAAHQDPDGFWDSDSFKGSPLNDVGNTGLALLALMDSGSSMDKGPHRKQLKAGVKYLCDVQDEDGCLTTKNHQHYMYNHAIGCLALVEAYGRSRQPILEKPAVKALHYVHTSKNPGKAWRYNDGIADPIEQNDVSVTGWMMMCLASARKHGLAVEEQDLNDGLAYIEEMTDPETGRTGYKETGSYSAREMGDEQIWPFEQVEAMTAVGMMCRAAFEDSGKNKAMLDKGAALLLARKPLWDPQTGSIDYYYWYYGTQAMGLRGGAEWIIWRDHVVPVLAQHQEADGSWDPTLGPWGENGGRVYSTALCTRTLTFCK